MKSLQSLSTAAYNEGQSRHVPTLKPATPIDVEKNSPEKNIKIRLEAFLSEKLSNATTCELEFGGLTIPFYRDKDRAQKLFHTLQYLEKSKIAEKLQAYHIECQGEHYVLIPPASLPQMIDLLGFPPQFAKKIRDIATAQRNLSAGEKPEVAEAAATPSHSQISLNTLQVVNNAEAHNPWKKNYSSRKILEELLKFHQDQPAYYKKRGVSETRLKDTFNDVLKNFIPKEHHASLPFFMSSKGSYKPLEKGWWSAPQVAVLLFELDLALFPKNIRDIAYINTILDDTRLVDQEEAIRQFDKFSELKSEQQEALKKQLVRSAVSMSGHIDLTGLRDVLEDARTPQKIVETLRQQFPLTAPSYITDVRTIIHATDTSKTKLEDAYETVRALMLNFSDSCPSENFSDFIVNFPACFSALKYDSGITSVAEKEAKAFVSAVLRMSDQEMNKVTGLITSARERIVAKLQEIKTDNDGKKLPSLSDLLPRIKHTLREEEAKLVTMIQEQSVTFPQGMAFLHDLAEHKAGLGEIRRPELPVTLVEPVEYRRTPAAAGSWTQAVEEKKEKERVQGV